MADMDCCTPRLAGYFPITGLKIHARERVESLAVWFVKPKTLNRLSHRQSGCALLYGGQQGQSDTEFRPSSRLSSSSSGHSILRHFSPLLSQVLDSPTQVPDHIHP